jgi:large subunit ribosomal protein L7/L12
LYKSLSLPKKDFAPGDEMPTVPLPPFSSPDGGIDAPPHIHELAEEIIHLNMIELKSLMDRIGDHFGFDEGGGYDDSEEGGADEGGGEEVKEEKTTWDLRLEAFDAKSKIKVIKEIRSVTGLGLKEAKELVEGAPVSVVWNSLE